MAAHGSDCTSLKRVTDNFPRACLELLVALGAGFIPAAALLDLIPEAVAENPLAGPLIAHGYLTLFVAENVALSLGT